MFGGVRASAAAAVASAVLGVSSTVAAQTNGPPPSALVVNGVFEAFLERAKVGVEYQIHPFQREYGGHGLAFGLAYRHFTSQLSGSWSGGFASLRYSYDAVIGGVIVVSPYASVDVGVVEDSCGRDLRAPNGCYGALALVSGGVDLGGIISRRWLVALRVGLGSIPIYSTNRAYSMRLFEVGVSTGVLF